MQHDQDFFFVHLIGNDSRARYWSEVPGYDQFAFENFQNTFHMVQEKSFHHISTVVSLNELVRVEKEARPAGTSVCQE